MRGVSHSGCYPLPSRGRAYARRRDRRDLGPPVPSLAETPLCALFFSPSGEFNYPRENTQGLPVRVSCRVWVARRSTNSVAVRVRSFSGGRLKVPRAHTRGARSLNPTKKTFSS